MNFIETKKGFTLIELLIVITIIGVLAVAFLPSLLGAPAKARDVQRMTDVNKIAAHLTSLHAKTGNIKPFFDLSNSDPNYFYEWILKKHFYDPTANPPYNILSSFGGKAPMSPKKLWVADIPSFATYTDYVVFRCSSPYAFSVVTRVEVPNKNGNSNIYCPAKLSTPTNFTPLFVVLVSQ